MKKKTYIRDIRFTTEKNIFVCDRHPRYRGIRKPTGKCLVCKMLYEAYNAVSRGPRETKWKTRIVGGVEGTHGL